MLSSISENPSEVELSSDSSEESSLDASLPSDFEQSFESEESYVPLFPMLSIPELLSEKGSYSESFELLSGLVLNMVPFIGVGMLEPGMLSELWIRGELGTSSLGAGFLDGVSMCSSLLGIMSCLESCVLFIA